MQSFDTTCCHRPYYGLQPKKASVHSGTGTRWRAKSRRSPRRRWEPTAAAGGAFGGAGGRARRLRPCPDHPGPSVARFSRARGPRAPRGLAWPRSAAGARCSRSASARRAGASGEGGCAGYAGPRDTRPMSSAKRGAPPASRARPAPRNVCPRRVHAPRTAAQLGEVLPSAGSAAASAAGSPSQRALTAIMTTGLPVHRALNTEKCVLRVVKAPSLIGIPRTPSASSRKSSFHCQKNSFPQWGPTAASRVWDA